MLEEHCWVQRTSSLVAAGDVAAVAVGDVDVVVVVVDASSSWDVHHKNEDDGGVVVGDGGVDFGSGDDPLVILENPLQLQDS